MMEFEQHPTEPNTIIIKTHKRYIAKHSDEDLRAAVLAEREACAQLCDDASLYFIDQGMNAVDGADYCANEIRGRTEPKSDFKNQMDDNWSGII
jgi:hypothetical protein